MDATDCLQSGRCCSQTVISERHRAQPYVYHPFCTLPALGLDLTLCRSRKERILFLCIVSITSSGTETKLGLEQPAKSGVSNFQFPRERTIYTTNQPYFINVGSQSTPHPAIASPVDTSSSSFYTSLYLYFPVLPYSTSIYSFTPSAFAFYALCIPETEELYPSRLCVADGNLSAV